MARRLSATPAFMLYMKQLFPTVWFGIVGLSFLRAIWSHDGLFSAAAALVTGMMLLMAFAMFKNLVWNLADEVIDDGDGLIVRHGQSVRRILKADVFDVYVMSATRVELRVRTATGDSRLAFAPRARWPPLSTDPTIKDLAERVRASRA